MINNGLRSKLLWDIRCYAPGIERARAGGGQTDQWDFNSQLENSKGIFNAVLEIQQGLPCRPLNSTGVCKGCFQGF
jgi:hypothetical protein